MPVRWLSAEALQSERIRRRMEHECHISQSYVDPTAYRKARRHANGLINFSRSAGLELGRACNTEKVNWPGLSDARARPGRAGLNFGHYISIYVRHDLCFQNPCCESFIRLHFLCDPLCYPNICL